MFEQRGALLGHHRLEVRIVLARAQCRPFEERDHLVEHREVAGDLNVVGGGICQPHAIVGDPRAHSLPRRRQPPVLHVALDELPRRSAQEMLARQRRLRYRERHHVLQLVAKAIGATGLVERRPRQDPTGEGLVEQPAIEQDVHGTIGCLHLHRTEDILPVLGHRAEDLVEVGAAVAQNQGERLCSRRRLTEEEDDLDRAVRLERERSLQGAAGIETGTGPVGERKRARPAPRVEPACRCGRETPSGRLSKPVAFPRGRQTRRGRRTRYSKGCAPASPPCLDRYPSRRTVPRRHGRCRAPTPHTR